MIQCPICDFINDNILYVSLHFRMAHNKTSKELYVLLNCENQQEPTCKCGCGNSVKFLTIRTGFREYVRGHASRVNNNWGHNKEAQNKSIAKRRKMIKDGSFKPFALKETGLPWNLGLTAETDQRIAKLVKSNMSNEAEIKKKSERMRIGRSNGTIRTVRGEESGNWKGGYSPLVATCATNRKFYNNWKYPILKKHNFSCSGCGTSNGKLQVHHDKEMMHEIVRKVADANKWPERLSLPVNSNTEELYELKLKIANEVAEYHITNNVSGIPLCKECHRIEHNNLNFSS